jgi:hypothetical protein
MSRLTFAAARGGASLAVAAAAMVHIALAGQTPPARPAVPVEPVEAVLDAFRTHQLVALGEPHRNEQAHAMRVALIRDRRIASVVDDIVVEFGSARYQTVVDRFVGGEQVPSEVLQQVWQNTTQGHTVWDVPIYEQFFRVVRDVNRGLPPGERLRILLGDPPTDWENVRGWEDVARPMADHNRDRYPADLIRREVLAKGRRALIIYGDGHLWREAGFPALASLLREASASLYTVASTTLVDLEAIQPTVAAWPAPAIATLSGTWLGVKEFTHYFPVPAEDAVRWRSVRLQDQFDAVAYYGPRRSLSYSELSPSHCLDPAYMRMRLGRLAWVPPGAPNLAERLKQYCAKVTK